MALTRTLGVAVLDVDSLGDAALARLGDGAQPFVVFGTSGSNTRVLDRMRNLRPDVTVEDGGQVADVREAIIECAKRKIVVLTTSTPSDPTRFVGHALQGAAAATEFEVPGVMLTVARDEVQPGGVAWLSQSGGISGYGVLVAVGLAQLRRLPCTFIEPPAGVTEPRTPEALEEAIARIVADPSLGYTRLSDPSPAERALRDGFSVAVQPMLDAPGGRALLHRDELPRKSMAEGNPAALVRLIEEFPGDVVGVFDGVHLVYGSSSAGATAGAIALALSAMIGVGIVAAPAASASPTGATGNTAVVQVEGSWYETVLDVVNNLHFTAVPHQGGESALRIVNQSSHSVTIEVTAYHGHGGSEAGDQNPTIAAGQSLTVQAPSGGVKHWSTATITAIDGVPLPGRGIEMVKEGVTVTRTPEAIQTLVNQIAPNPDPITWTDDYTPPAPTPVATPTATAIPGGTVRTEIITMPAPTVVTPPVTQEIPEDTHTIVTLTPETVPQLQQATPTATPQPKPAVPQATPNLVPQAVPTPAAQTPQAVPPLHISPNAPGTLDGVAPVPEAPGPMLVPTAVPSPAAQTPQATPNLVPQAVPTPAAQTPQAVPPLHISPNAPGTLDGVAPVPEAPGPMLVPTAVPEPAAQTPQATPNLVPQAVPTPAPQTPEAVPPLHISPNAPGTLDGVAPVPEAPGPMLVPTAVPSPAAQTPQATPHLVPQAVPTPAALTPEAIPPLHISPNAPTVVEGQSAVPVAMPQATPDAVPTPTPQAVPQATPQAEPVATTPSTSTTAAEVTATPDTTSTTPAPTTTATATPETATTPATAGTVTTPRVAKPTQTTEQATSNTPAMHDELAHTGANPAVLAGVAAAMLAAGAGLAVASRKTGDEGASTGGSES